MVSITKLVLLKFQCASGLPGRLLKAQTVGSTLRVSDCVGVLQGQKSVFFNQFPGDAEADGPDTTYQEPLL